jgi:hypothetical protein
MPGNTQALIEKIQTLPPDRLVTDAIERRIAADSLTRLPTA